MKTASACDSQEKHKQPQQPTARVGTQSFDRLSDCETSQTVDLQGERFIGVISLNACIYTTRPRFPGTPKSLSAFLWEVFGYAIGSG